MSDAPNTPELDNDRPEITDPDQYHERERLREIHDARQTVHKILRDINPYTQTSEHEQQKGRLAHAVSAYIAELEPLFIATDVDTELPEPMPWDTLESYADTLGTRYDKEDPETPSYKVSTYIFRQANAAFAEIKPVVDDETDEWEV
jgi:hypothetical protein